MLLEIDNLLFNIATNRLVFLRDSCVLVNFEIFLSIVTILWFLYCVLYTIEIEKMEHYNSTDLLIYAAQWRKRLGARLPPLGSRVRVSVPPCVFRGGRNGIWVGFSQGFSRFPLPQISFHLTGMSVEVGVNIVGLFREAIYERACIFVVSNALYSQRNGQRKIVNKTRPVRRLIFPIHVHDRLPHPPL